MSMRSFSEEFSTSLFSVITSKSPLPFDFKQKKKQVLTIMFTMFALTEDQTKPW